MDVGWGFNEPGPGSATAAEGLSPVARDNRAILVSVMSASGFVNYPHEWWHWSYGDRYWALCSGNPVALYGPR